MSNVTDEGFVIRVDRKVKPRYPYNCKAFDEHQEVGPESYRLDLLRLGLHNYQVEENRGSIQGLELFNELRYGGPIDECLSLLDGQEIVKLGIDNFRRFFGEKEIILWNGASRDCLDRDKNIRVPILSGNQSWVSIRWHDLYQELGVNQYTALFPL